MADFLGFVCNIGCGHIQMCPHPLRGIFLFLGYIQQQFVFKVIIYANLYQNASRCFDSNSNTKISYFFWSNVSWCITMYQRRNSQKIRPLQMKFFHAWWFRKGVKANSKIISVRYRSAENKNGEKLWKMIKNYHFLQINVIFSHLSWLFWSKNDIFVPNKE